MSTDRPDLADIRARQADISHLGTDWADHRMEDGSIEIHDADGDLRAVLPDHCGALSRWMIAARSDVPALLSEVERLRAERDRYRTAWTSARRGRAAARARATTIGSAYMRGVGDGREQGDAITVPRERIIAALRKQGAWCGDCDFETDSGCDGCAQVLRIYADAVLEVLDADARVAAARREERERCARYVEDGVLGSGSTTAGLAAEIRALPDTEDTPCPVCGREPRDQEHGPDRRCRHTPATRLRGTSTTEETPTDLIRACQMAAIAEAESALPATVQVTSGDDAHGWICREHDDGDRWGYLTRASAVADALTHVQNVHHTAPTTTEETPEDEGRTWKTVRVQRACNGCGNDLRDVNAAELNAAVAGRPLPDVTGECPTCTPAAARTTTEET